MQLTFKAFFQGKSLSEETRYWQMNETAHNLMKVNLWTLLFAEIFVSLVAAVSQTGMFQFNLLYGALGVLLGVIGGFGWGVVWGLNWGLVWSWVLGISVGIAMGLEGFYQWDWVWGISMGSALGIATGITGGFHMSAFGGLVTAVASGLVSSFILGKEGGFLWAVSFLLSYLCIWTRWIYMPFFLLAPIIKVKPDLLPSHWDENIHAPVPGLKNILVRMASKDFHEAMNESIFLVQKRPAQREAAQAALVNIATSVMEEFKDIDDIANLKQKLDFLPYDTEVFPKDFTRGFEKLVEFSEYTQAILEKQDLTESLSEMESLTLRLMRFQKKMDTGRGGTDKQFMKLSAFWLKLVERASLELARKTATLLPDPFIVNRPLKAGSALFFGRESLIKEIQNAAVQLRTVGAIVMLGSPLVGKSSLLLNLKQYIQSDIKVAYVDCKDKITSESLRFFCKTTAKSIHRAIGKRTKFTLMCTTLTDLTEYLRSIQNELEEQNFRILLCFDHYDKLTEKIVNYDFKGFPAAVRFWIQRLPRTTVLLSGTKSPKDIPHIEWTNNIGNFRVIPVKPLDTKSALELVNIPVKKNRLKFNCDADGLTDFVYRLGGHPYLLQTAMSELINLLNSKSRKEADKEDVDKVIRYLLTSSNNFFEQIWFDGLTEKEKTLLTSLAQNQSIPRASYESVDSLTVKYIIRPSDSGYRFCIPVFQEWIIERIIQ